MLSPSGKAFHKKVKTGLSKSRKSVLIWAISQAMLVICMGIRMRNLAGKKKTKIWHVKNTITEDTMSRWLREFSFDIHGFGHHYNGIHNVCDYRVVGDFELIFVVGGQSLITIGQTQYRFGKGGIALIPPFIRNKIDTLPDDPHDNYWIHFDIRPFYRQDEFRQMLEMAIRKNTKEQFSEVLYPLLLQMEREATGEGPGSALLFELLFRQLLIALVRNAFEEKMYVQSGGLVLNEEKELLDRAIGFIQDNLEQPVRIKDICEHLHISESYLHKIFSGQMHLSPNYMIQLCKVKRAEQLLRSGSYSIKEVAEKLCFSSQYYFSTVFKRFYGVSPRGFQDLL